MSSPHKLAFYVAWLWGDTARPEEVEVALLGMLCVAELFLDIPIPVPQLDWDLDRWWEEAVRQQREEVKGSLIDTYGQACECCEERPGFDLHEVFTPRSHDTTWRQILLFTVENCALVCPICHQSTVIYSDEFKDKIRKRRELLAKR